MRGPGALVPASLFSLAPRKNTVYNSLKAFAPRLRRLRLCKDPPAIIVGPSLFRRPTLTFFLSAEELYTAEIAMLSLVESMRGPVIR